MASVKKRSHTLTSLGDPSCFFFTEIAESFISAGQVRASPGLTIAPAKATKEEPTIEGVARTLFNLYWRSHQSQAPTVPI